MDKNIQFVKVNGRMYKLVHPGVRKYFEIKKKLAYAITDINNPDDMALEIDNVKLFDYCFGKSPSDTDRVVYAVTSSQSSFVDWAHETKKPTKWAPTQRELEEVWAPVLNRFLASTDPESVTSKEHRIEWPDNVDELSEGQDEPEDIESTDKVEPERRDSKG